VSRHAFATIERRGVYLRVADPEWGDPLDPSFAQAGGGRWNPPGSFAVLYLSADVATARANVDRRFADLPYGAVDLQTDRQPVLVGADVPPSRFVDVVTEDGCTAAGLPASYALDARGDEIAHATCQPIGAAAKAQGFPGIACRSAARPGGEELAWFVDEIVAPTGVRPFDDWYWAP
jgi:RES domain-containing protein